MDKYRKHNYTSLPGDSKRYTSRGERDQNPSFSSTLLDQIYRSIDENNDHRVAVDDEVVLSRETVTIKKKKQYIYTSVEKKEAAHFQRIEKNKASDNIYQRKNGENYGGLMTLNSSWSSSDSSSGGLFSSEADSNYGVSSLYAHRPKPIRTSTEKISHEEKRKHTSDSVVKRSKLKAVLKIYGDLKNVKQPISPGAKLASFLNSLFSARENTKKGKFSGANSSTASACSASRSCLSKTPSTREKLSDSAAKKSVRFHPVSASMDKSSQLQRGNRGNDSEVPDQRNRVNDEVMYDLRRKNQRVEERTRELLQNYARKAESESDEDEDEDDDDASYASSDLFELDSLNNCGINVRGDYMEELPVYETTYLHANLLALQTN